MVDRSQAPKNQEGTLKTTAESSSPALPVPYDIEIQTSVPKGLKGTVGALVREPSVAAAIIRRFGPEVTKVSIEGKKKGPPELRSQNSTVTLTISSDAGLLKKFSQQLREGDSAAKAELAIDTQTSRETTRAAVMAMLQGVLHWAARDFSAPPPSELREFLGKRPTLQGEIVSPRLDGGTESPGLTALHSFAADDQVKRVLKSISSSAAGEARRAFFALRDDKGLLRPDMVMQHAEALARCAAASTVRCIATGSALEMQEFLLELQRALLLFDEQFTKNVALAIEISDRAVLENFVSVVSAVQDAWRNTGVIPLYSYTSILMGRLDSSDREFVHSLETYRDRVHRFLSIHDDLASSALPETTDVEGHIFDRLVAVHPALSVPPYGDLRPWRTELDAFGFFLVRLALSGHSSHVTFFRDAYRGLLKPREDGQDDSPELVIGMLKEMCVWARDGKDPRVCPEIHAGDDLLNAVAHQALFQSINCTFERLMMTEETRTIDESRGLLKLLEDQAKMFSTIFPTHPAQEVVELTILLARFHEATLRIDHDAEPASMEYSAADSREVVLIAQQGLSRILQLSPAILTNHKQDIIDFLANVVEVLRQLEQSGGLGESLTVAESALTLFDILNAPRGNVREKYREVTESALNVLISVCEQVYKQSETAVSSREDLQALLEEVRNQIGAWKPVPGGTLSASRQHVEQHYRRAKKALSMYRAAK
jgi:hypothetical protein